MDPVSNVLNDEQKLAVLQQLQTFGFSGKQAQLAMKALSMPSALSNTLLSTFEPLQACLEYLILHLPECDLPERFLPNVNSSNPFVSSVHAGTEDIKARWVEEKAIKECGWPAHIVKECLTDKRLARDWGLLQQALNRALLGRAEGVVEEESTETEVIDEEELAAYGAQFVDERHLIVPLPFAPLQLHLMLLSEHRVLPLRGEPPPMYITSTTVAAYVRLYILSQLLSAFQSGSLLDPGENVIMAAVRFIEEAWVAIEENGPPEMSDVLHHFLRRKQNTSQVEGDDLSNLPVQPSSKRRQERNASRRDDRNDQVVKTEFERVRHGKDYADILASRTRLPAFAARDGFLDLLHNNRCVIVVGETGNVIVLRLGF